MKRRLLAILTGSAILVGLGGLPASASITATVNCSGGLGSFAYDVTVKNQKQLDKLHQAIAVYNATNPYEETCTVSP